ncbi:putative antitoxin, CopG family [Candidatus Methanophagaceae archaeon]|jgi:predicted CopG family antitoxin|nr:putative antitoxin, CopG family [Methanophagales archaeon]
MKSEDEDVSGAIIRVLKKKSGLVECAGLWSDIPDKEIEEIEEGMKEMRKSLILFVEGIQKKTL